MCLVADGVVGNPPAQGTLTATLDDLAGAGAGTVDVAGGLALSLEDLLGTAAGTVDVAGVLAATLDDLTLSATGWPEILGLVVDESARSRGVGARLVAAAELWATGLGLPEMRVRSRDTRERAHRFYLNAGYEIWKRQVVFRKRIDRAD